MKAETEAGRSTCRAGAAKEGDAEEAVDDLQSCGEPGGRCRGDEQWANGQRASDYSLCSFSGASLLTFFSSLPGSANNSNDASRTMTNSNKTIISKTTRQQRRQVERRRTTGERPTGVRLFLVLVIPRNFVSSSTSP